MSVVTRFAPSPTGALHIGGARTAIFNWLYARHHGGKFLLRIEDTDQVRSTEESLEEILESLKWLGLDWDGTPVRQSARLEVYRTYAAKLVEAGKAYRCYLTPEELAVKREEAKAQGKPFRYRREWARGTGETDGKPFAVRLLTPDEGTIDFEDAIRGAISFDAREIDDFVILRADGFPTYNFAVVVDDAEMGITDVIRGDDHLANTPKQILIYEALGFAPPRFAHVSMILGQDKTKLSKRHGAHSVLAYRKLGYLPEAIVNYLARLGWSYGDQEIFSREELIEKFTLENIVKSPAVFNPEKLLWLNGWYIRTKSAEEIAALVIPILRERGYAVQLDARTIRVVDMLREREKTLLDIAKAAHYFFSDDIEYEEGARSKFLTEEQAPVIEALIEELSLLERFDQASIREAYDRITSRMGLPLVKVAQPTRVALTGGTVSPGIFEVMEVLGRDRVLSRLKRALHTIKGKSQG
jgi:glutamyl-tRNA synthetase